jgi:thymidylate synthase ThyX
MNITVAPIRNTTGMGLSPEMLAAVGARYSRSSMGYEEIVAQIGDDADTAVDRIFKFVDYGHASIADMVPVAMFVDGCSMLFAFVMFNLCQQQAGQECSTRYIQMNEDVRQWHGDKTVSTALLGHYTNAISAYTAVAPDPETKNTSPGMVERLRRNWVLDRARVYLPLGAPTGLMMLQSAREWVRVIQLLKNAPRSLPEFHSAAEIMLERLATVSPRMVHLCETDANQSGALQEWMSEYLMTIAPHQMAPSARIVDPDVLSACIVSHSRMRMREPLSPEASACPVVLKSTMRIAEARDINRHRPGGRRFAWSPGFSQCGSLPWESMIDDPVPNDSVDHWCNQLVASALSRVEDGDASALYDLPLGSHMHFRISTQLDKAVYLIELRTRRGGHPAYKSICAEWGKQLRSYNIPICDYVDRRQ